MWCRCHNCCRFARESLEFAIRDDISSPTPPPDVIRLRMCLNQLTNSNRSPQRVYANKGSCQSWTGTLHFVSANHLTYLMGYLNHRSIQRALNCVCCHSAERYNQHPRREICASWQEFSWTIWKTRKVFCRTTTIGNLKRIVDIGHLCPIRLEMTIVDQIWSWIPTQPDGGWFSHLRTVARFSRTALLNEWCHSANLSTIRDCANDKEYAER